MDNTAQQDYEIKCQDGVVLRGKRYTSKNSETSPTSASFRILCWHGWLDNCQSFYNLAPYLVQKLSTQQSTNVELASLSFPGHGRSTHKSMDGPPMLLMDFCYYLHETLEFLGWEPSTVSVIGHSMGAGVSLLYAASYPFRHLILLDSLGPYVKEPDPPSKVAEHLRKHITERLKGKKAPSVYRNKEEAVATRIMSAKYFPGKQYISKETAMQLVEGASRRLEDGSIEFLHDPRLKSPSILYLTQAQVDAFLMTLAKADTKVAVFLAEDGMPFPDDSVQHFQTLSGASVVKRLPGSHHFHADPAHFEAVGRACLDVLVDGA